MSRMLWALVLCQCVVMSAAATTAAKVPVEAFSQLPQFTRPSLSPSGNRIAYLHNAQQPEVTVMGWKDRTTGEQGYLFSSDNLNARINWLRWVNESTILFSVRFADNRGGVDTKETRLLSINVEHENPEPTVLIKPHSFRDHISQFQDKVIDDLPDDPDHVLIEVDLDVQNQPSVYKLNVHTGAKSRVEKGKRQIRWFMTDQQHRVRLGEKLSYRTGEAVIYVRQANSEEWQSLYEYDALKAPGIEPLGFDLDPNILYFAVFENDRKVIKSMDLRSKEQTLVYKDPDYDADGRLIYSSATGEVIGITHLNSPTGRIYWKGDRQRLLDGLNKALPEFDNYLVDFSRDERVYLMYSETSNMPGAYFLGDRDKGTLELVFEQYPEIPTDLGTQRLVTYQARDGVSIEGYLSRPAGQDGPVPTILHPHGGPGARDVSGFDYWTSYFLSRGYAVFRPNFRGSTGYGYTFAQQQMQGWGLAMQDDLTDAAHWLVEQGIAQKDRMCIVGASYGGYAALMATVKTPDLFQCAVSFAGVSDLPELISHHRRYVGLKFVRNQIGTDSDDMEARSPYYHAKSIKTPILLVHGEDDRVVDKRQSALMADALEDEDKDVEYILLPQGDHYLSIQGNRHRFFRAMDAFLHTHLAK
ncbi:S9 family peptidase [Aestuariibacter halophilus]|uniref:S9 family peptidase n=1 Tax=Fluctibacter halophilus TaxID=226011 RepID=A0ABS8G8W6_9ALTE|nr:S9 family peptidase [Aestuariibacter halophilus]MCC2616990.1 S9 family peptidase [Aestuariibacter halophilus]